MTQDHRTPDEIEKDIARDRSELTGAIDALKDQFSVEKILGDAGSQLGDFSSEVGRAASRSVRDNPVPLLLTAVGIGWMMMNGSSGRRDEGRGTTDQLATSPSAARVPVDTERNLAWADAASDWRDDHAPHEDGSAGVSAGDVDGDGSANSTLADARARAASAGQSAKAKVASAAAGLSSGLESAGASARTTTLGARDRIQRYSARIAAGTESLSEDARERVIAARWRALEARDEAMQAARRGADRMESFFEDQPLVAGALAVAVGASIGAALPRTPAEDEALGARSDSLFRDAQRVLHDELNKAKAVGEAVAEEGRRAAKDLRGEADRQAPAGKSAVKAVADKARDAADRIAERAQSESRRQGLGDSVDPEKRSADG